MIIDTHTHLYLDEFADGRSEAVDRAIDAGVAMMIFPNVDHSTLSPMKELHTLRPDSTAMAIGLHPTEVDGREADDQLAFVADELRSTEKYVAVGEIGIDLYWDKTFRDNQMEVFGLQMEMAAERDLPVIIHCRDGLAETLDVIDNLRVAPRGVFHSFGGSEADVEAIRRRGDFYFGINGIVTFKNSRLREVLPTIGANRIVLETDSPYLAPVPHRGKRNESAFIVHTAALVAAALNMGIDQLTAITSANAADLFNLNLS